MKIDKAILKNECALDFKEHFNRFASATQNAGAALCYASTFGKNLKKNNIDTLKERAYENEARLRVLNADLLDHLNGLYQNGQMDRVMERIANAVEKKQLDFSGAIAKAKEYFKSNHSEIDTSFFDAAQEMLDQHKFKVSRQKDNLVVETTGQDGKPAKTVISMKRQVGAIGQISKADLFGVGKVKLTPPVDIRFDDENCHHRNYRVEATDKHAHDIYEKFVANMVLTNESAYRHARILDEYGKPHLRGEDPVTAVIAVLAIIAAALIIAGAVIEIGCAAGAWNGSVCDIGWFLIGVGVIFGIAAITCAVSGCTILIGLAGTVAA